MFNTRKIFFLLLLLISFGIQAQVDTTKHTLRKDTVSRLYDKKILPAKILRTNDSIKLSAFKPDPTRVVWMAAIIPGYGQIINRKYWKLPIVYGGFLGCAYAVSWNSNMYQTYLTAYRDILSGDPANTSYLQLIPTGRTMDSFGGTSAFTAILKSKQENYRRYRDLSIIATVAYYALTIVDAFVDAQLYDFDISPDLSLRVQPTLLKTDFGAPNTLGMQCSISLR